MAEASFTIRAVDATRQAFLNVQSSLNQLKKSSATAAAFMQKAFSPKALGTGLAAAFGISLVGAIDAAVDALVRFATKADRIKQSMLNTAREIDRIRAEGARQLMDPEQRLAQMGRDRRKLEAEIFALKEKTAKVSTERVTIDRTGRTRSEFQATQKGTEEEVAQLNALQKELEELINSENLLRRTRLEARTEDAANAFDAIIAAQKEANDRAEAARNAIQTVKDSVREAADAQRDLLDPLREYQRELDAVNELQRQGALTAAEAEGRRTQIMAARDAVINREINLLREAAEAQRDILDPTRQYQRELDLVNDLLARNLLSEEEAARRRAQINSAATAAATAEQDELAASFRDFEEARARAYGQQISNSEQLAKLRADEAQGLAKLNALAASDVEGQKAQLRELVRIYDELGPAMAEQIQLARDAGDMMAQGFEDAIFAGERLSDVLRQLGLDLMRLIFRNLVTAPLAGGITDIIKGVFGMKADGGAVIGRKPYIVGERGPEMFLPGTSGAIIPNSRLRTEARTGADISDQSSATANVFASFGQSIAGLSSSVLSAATAIGEGQRRPEEPKKDQRGVDAIGSAFSGLTETIAGLSSAISSLAGSLDFSRSVTDPITSALARADRPGDWTVMRDEISGLRASNADSLAEMAQATRPQTQPVQSGPTINVNYTIQSGVSRAELAPILESERKRLKAEIPDMVRRGGSYRSAFA